MQFQKKLFKIRQIWSWPIGLLAFLWVLFRSVPNAKRLSYPCQQAAMPLAIHWLLATGAFLGTSLFLRKFLKFSGILLLIVGIIWILGTSHDVSQANENSKIITPTWEVPKPISTVFVYNSIPPTSGSLAAGDASVPDEYLSDPATDNLLEMLKAHGIFLHKGSQHPDGIIGSKDVVVIKGNFQWTSRNTTSPDSIKGLIWQILQHPEVFSGDILVCDNTQEIGTGINEEDNNSYDPNQSILDVVSTFNAKGYPVYCLDWNYIWDTVVQEYLIGDYKDGYVYEEETKISYPKFQSPSGNYYISLRHGIWNPARAEYDSDRLSIIDFPVLKAHGMTGATIGLKNWIGVLTTAYNNARYGGWSPMHQDYFFSPYALVARVMAVTFPKLTIVDATWTSPEDVHHLDYVQSTRKLLTSTDPVAVSWYAAKYILTPIALRPYETDPDLDGSLYNNCLNNWTAFLQNSGFSCTNNASEISVYRMDGLYKLDLRVTRDREKAWILEREYGTVEFSVESEVIDSVATYILYRKESDGDYHSITEISSSELQDDRYTYLDKHLEQEKTYTYRVEALDTNGLLLCLSYEITLYGGER